jgi:hypothetical protein
VHLVSSDLHLYRCDSEFSPAGNFKIDLVPDTLSPAACCCFSSAGYDRRLYGYSPGLLDSI